MISNIGKNNTRIEAFDMTHDQNPLIPRDSLRVFNRKEHYGTSPSDSYPKYCFVHLDFLTKSHEKFDFTFSFLIKIASMFEVHLSRTAQVRAIVTRNTALYTLIFYQNLMKKFILPFVF